MKQRHDAHASTVYPIFRPLDAHTNKLLQPQSMWTEEEKKGHYMMKENEEELVYHKHLWLM